MDNRPVHPPFGIPRTGYACKRIEDIDVLKRNIFHGFLCNGRIDGIGVSYPRVCFQCLDDQRHELCRITRELPIRFHPRIRDKEERLLAPFCNRIVKFRLVLIFVFVRHIGLIRLKQPISLAVRHNISPGGQFDQRVAAPGELCITHGLQFVIGLALFGDRYAYNRAPCYVLYLYHCCHGQLLLDGSYSQSFSEKEAIPRMNCVN